jgi:hypothetical protein
MRGVLIFFSMLLMPLWVCSQFYDHYTFRPALMVQKQLNNIFEVNIEYQNRRQNGLFGDNLNVFRLPYQQSTRIWLFANFDRITPQDRKFEFALSPLAYFKSFQLQGKPEDLEQEPTQEIRFTLQGEFFQYFNFFRLQNRSGFEYRYFWDDDGTRRRGRFRNRFQIQFKLYKKLRLNIHNEYFLNTPPNVSVNYFNQNRTGIAVVYRTDKIRIEPGYIFIYNQRQQLHEIDRENGLVINLTYFLN